MINTGFSPTQYNQSRSLRSNSQQQAGFGASIKIDDYVKNRIKNLPSKQRNELQKLKNAFKALRGDIELTLHGYCLETTGPNALNFYAYLYDKTQPTDVLVKTMDSFHLSAGYGNFEKIKSIFDKAIKTYKIK